MADYRKTAALNRQVAGSIPTASTKESTTYENFLPHLGRTSPNCFRTPQIPPYQALFCNRRRSLSDNVQQIRLIPIKRTP
jgi:hypothetical protein